MYLIDTNIFLEILLSQEQSKKCKKELSEKIGTLHISDFSLHSIGVILFRYNNELIFNKFIADVLPIVDILTLSKKAYEKIAEVKQNFGLDFDDAYQYMIASENGLTIVTMDKDFKSIANHINIKFL
ncbi:MAG: PIN domain-containing protein [Desulfobacteraceae bacterium]|nr:PIN domain-containing protein [Desulfobacteraceae bacterium]